MRVVIRKTKEGFRVVEAIEVRIDNDGSVIVYPVTGEEFKVGRDKSWDRKKVEEFLEQEGAYSGAAINLSPLSRNHDKWKEAPF